MHLAYAPEAEAFRAELRDWLTANLPAGWGDDDFEMTPEERKAFNERWPRQLYEGGWICATWPKEYGGKGLSTMQGVVLAEEFARAKAPLRADFFGDTLVGPTILQWGTEEQKKEFLPRILNGSMRWCQGFSEPNSGSDLASLKTTCRARRRRVGDQRSEGVDHRRAPRRLLLPADPHRPGRAEAQGHLLPARADAPAGRRGPRHHPTRRHGRVLRGVLHRRPLPEGQRGRRRQQRLEGRQLDAGVRARHVGHHRLPPLRGGVQADGRAGPGERRASTIPPSASAWRAYYTKIQILRINGLRSLSATLAGTKDPASPRSVPPTRCSGARCTSEAMELALDIFGAVVDADRRRPDVGLVARGAARQAPTGLPGQPDDRASFFFSRSETIWGGTSQIQRNIVGERVLGLPKEPS